MRAVILAGGLGTRLAPIINNMPKPMAPICGKPFLEIIMSHLACCGVKEFILCVSYLRERISEHFGHEYMGIPINYSIEQAPLGTGGAIRQAFGKYDIDNALVLNGDTYIDADYGAFYQLCENEILGIMLTVVADANRYGIVQINNDRIEGFYEKIQGPNGGLISAGVYKISKQMMVKMPVGAFSFEKDFLEPQVAVLKPKCYIHDGYFIDIGTPQSYARALNDYAKKWGQNDR